MFQNKSCLSNWKNFRNAAPAVVVHLPHEWQRPLPHHRERHRPRHTLKAPSPGRRSDAASGEVVKTKISYEVGSNSFINMNPQKPSKPKVPDSDKVFSKLLFNAWNTKNALTSTSTGIFVPNFWFPHQISAKAFSSKFVISGPKASKGRAAPESYFSPLRWCHKLHFVASCDAPVIKWSSSCSSGRGGIWFMLEPTEKWIKSLYVMAMYINVIMYDYVYACIHMYIYLYGPHSPKCSECWILAGNFREDNSFLGQNHVAQAICICM